MQMITDFFLFERSTAEPPPVVIVIVVNIVPFPSPSYLRSVLGTFPDPLSHFYTHTPRPSLSASPPSTPLEHVEHEHERKNEQTAHSSILARISESRNKKYSCTKPHISAPISQLPTSPQETDRDSDKRQETNSPPHPT